MNTMLNRLKERRFFQNLVIEIIANLLMLASGVIIGYFFKTIMF